MCRLRRSSPRCWQLLCLWILWSSVGGYPFVAHGQEALLVRSATSEPGTTAVPQKARDLLTAIEARDGRPLPGYVGSREFQNRERRLPRGRYREYDVNPKLRGRPRDGERIVIEQQSHKAYYSPDHYQTFLSLN
jgi:guanyl-specific ribonuclease Sa